MAEKRETFARFGIATKGLVYILIGGLTIMTTLGLGGKESGSTGALQFVAKQPFGQVLLGLIALGLAGYVFWRWYQTFADPEDRGTGLKGLTVRVAYFFSGLFYGFLSYSAVKIILEAGSGSGGSSGGGLLDSTWGNVLLAATAVALLGKAIYQLYQAYSGKFREKIEETSLDKKAQQALIRSGQLGFTARGIVIAITAFLLFRGIFTQDSGDLAGKKQAFSFLEGTFGNVVLVIIALGLVAYGIYMMIKAKYASKLTSA
ncbi:DUF1206 domain-containing protein [Rasiella sp. SM2506]|uniref:DUF1206 domain-containing protein n=1 Tax=Rasiella sp. SM2506 TaxID=3423914 RepID=UPI003D7BAEF9